MNAAPHRGRGRAVRLAALLGAALVLAAACAAAPAAALIPAGDLLWSQTFDASYDWCSAIDTALGPDGSLYVAGFAGASGSDACDFVLAKFSPAGMQRWVRTWDGPGHGFDAPSAVAVSSAGMVVVTGITSAGVNNDDMATVAWDFAGHHLWTKRVAGPADSLDEGNDVAVTARGSVYVAGAVGGNGSGLDFVVIKYAKNGHELWRRASDGSAHDRDAANALTLDGAGNVYAAGAIYSAGHGQNLALVKYSPSGHRRWLRTWNGPWDQQEQAQDVAVGGNAVTAVGLGQGIGLPQKAVIASYSLSGQRKFAAMIDPAGPFSSWFDHVAVDRSGHIVAGGWVDQGAGGGADMWLMRMDPNGDLAWSLPISGWAGEDERIADVAVTRTGTVYACGAIGTQANGDDVVVMRLTRGGVYKWWGQYDSGADDGAAALCMSRSAVYVVGEVGAPGAVFKFKR